MLRRNNVWRLNFSVKSIFRLQRLWNWLEGLRWFSIKSNNIFEWQKGFERLESQWRTTNAVVGPQQVEPMTTSPPSTKCSKKTMLDHLISCIRRVRPTLYRTRDFFLCVCITKERQNFCVFISTPRHDDAYRGQAQFPEILTSALVEVFSFTFHFTPTESASDA
jgi:hypothetical protein